MDTYVDTRVKSGQTTALFPLLLVNFIGTLGFSIVLPFLVALVTRLGGNALVYGMMGATYSIFQLVGAPILGSWSDTYGRRRILLLSQLGTFASWLVFLRALYLPRTTIVPVDSAVFGSFVISLPLVVLFTARAVDGLTGGNISVANAYLADITSEKDRKKDFGRMAMASNVGFIFGPTLRGLLGSTRFGEVPPVSAALSISLVASLVIAVYLPESKPCLLARSPEEGSLRKVMGQEQADCFRLAEPARRSWRQVLSLPRVAYLLGLNFVIFLAFNLFYTSFPVHAIQGMAWSVGEIGVFFSFVGLTMALVQGPLLGRLSVLASDVLLVVVGSLILGAGFVLYRSPDWLWIYAGGALFSLGNGLMWPSFLALLSRQAGDQGQGAVQGFSGSVGSLASVVGLLVGGALYGIVGSEVFLVSAALVFVVATLALRFVGSGGCRGASSCGGALSDRTQQGSSAHNRSAAQDSSAS